MGTHDSIVDESVYESRDGRGRHILVFAATLMTIMAIITAVSAWYVYETYHSAAQRGTNLAAQVKIACARGTITDSSIRALCDKADSVVDKAPVTPTIKGDKGDQGLPGATGQIGQTGPGPSVTQVAAAVAAYCAGGACKGIVSASEVKAAVTAYCSSRNNCQGNTGQQGVQGKEGDKGDSGAAGVAGKDGTNGADGTNGTNGQNAFPFQFQFVVNTLPTPTTYTCIVTDPANPVTCTSTQG